MKVLLQDVIDAIEQTTADCELYYYPDAETIFSVMDGVIQSDEEELQGKELDELNFDFIPLPSQYDRNDYGIMQDFTSQVDNPTAHEWLTNAIKGRGAFRMFRATVERFDLLEEWYLFRENAYEELAINWCNEYGIEYDASEVEYDDEFEEEIIVPHSNKIKTSIVEINKHNLASILYMVSDCYQEIDHMNDLDFVQEEFNSYMNSNHEIYALTLNGKAIGYYVLSLKEEAYLLEHIYIRKEERHKGNGTALLKHAEEIASENHKSLIMHVTPNNEIYMNLLKKNGYAIVEYIQIRK